MYECVEYLEEWDLTWSKGYLTEKHAAQNVKAYSQDTDTRQTLFQFRKKVGIAKDPPLPSSPPPPPPHPH